MKGTIASICIIGTIIGVCFVTSGYRRAVCKELIKDLQMCESYTLAGDWESAQNAVSAAATAWERHGPVMELFVQHEELHDIYDLLARIKASTETNDTESCIADNRGLRRYLEHLAESESISASNVF